MSRLWPDRLLVSLEPAAVALASASVPTEYRRAASTSSADGGSTAIRPSS